MRSALFVLAASLATVTIARADAPPPRTPHGRVKIERLVVSSIQKAAVGALETSLPALRACYEEALQRAPELAGVFNYHGKIVPGGALGDGASSGGSLRDKQVQSCIREALTKIVWPETARLRELFFELSFAPSR